MNHIINIDEIMWSRQNDFLEIFFHEINRKSDLIFSYVNLHLKNIWLNKNINIKFSNYNVLSQTFLKTNV